MECLSIFHVLRIKHLVKIRSVLSGTFCSSGKKHIICRYIIYQVMVSGRKVGNLGNDGRYKEVLYI